MKIAYIVTAYIDENQMRRLIDSLALYEGTAIADFYIHIDKKVDISPFRTAMNGCSANVYWCKNRYWINWGGFNQVRSQYELLRMIFEETKREYDRVVCLSATDYPLWSNKKIIDEFKRNPKVEYIGGYNLTASMDDAQRRKVLDYHFFRDISLPVKIKRCICGLSRWIMHHSLFHKKAMIIGSSGNMYDAFTGSDYWSLTYECAQYVYKTMRDDKKLMNYFRYSYIPSEGVINTIVFNSPYKGECTTYNEEPFYPGLEKLTPLHYTYYKGAIKIYQLEDWEELMATNKMFFRKARTGISDTLIEKLETEIRSK